MALTAGEIAGHPALHDFIRRQSQALLMAYDANPRLSSIFATQQRWLMAHVGLALYYRSDPDHAGLTMTRFLDAIRAHSVASPNTADTFLKEMLKYNFVLYGPERADKRFHPMYPAPTALEAINGWMMVHLATLDSLDDAKRLAWYISIPDGLRQMQPLVCDGLLASSEVRMPEKTFSLFTWLNNGGIIMDRLIAGIDDVNSGDEQISTSIASIEEMGRWLSLSRTHLARKLREAESLGSLGWRGKRGHSVMWVSKEFRGEYAMAQAVKLAIIDAAFEACAPASTG